MLPYQSGTVASTFSRSHACSKRRKSDCREARCTRQCSANRPQLGGSSVLAVRRAVSSSRGRPGFSDILRLACRKSAFICGRSKILTPSCTSDLGDSHERASGYYPQPAGDGKESNPYLFDQMTKNCKSWIQFHSNDDPFIPLREAEQIRDGLGLTQNYHMLPGRSHFFDFSPELLDAVLSLC